MNSSTERYPDVNSLKHKCHKKVPGFIWDYFDSATGKEIMHSVNRRDLDNYIIDSSILHGEIKPNLSVNFLGESYDLPFGVAPVGMSGLIRPNAEKMLHSCASDFNFPFCLSTVATISPEQLTHKASKHLWFQLYTPKDFKILDSMLNRLKVMNINNLVVTLDLPGPSVRERQIKSGITLPFQFTSSMLFECFKHPFWSVERLSHGMPTFEFLIDYSQPSVSTSSVNHIGYNLRCSPDRAYIEYLRANWDGKLIAKGVTSAEQLSKLDGLGFDCIWISNHAGRQYESGRSSLASLKQVRSKTDLPLIVDSGVETGLDILKLYHAGANFVMLGRPWHYALGALGKAGPAHLVKVLKRCLVANMHQTGIENLTHMERKHV